MDIDEDGNQIEEEEPRFDGKWIKTELKKMNKSEKYEKKVNKALKSYFGQ